jgi:lipopolysaccharide export system ATP-binding protein
VGLVQPNGGQVFFDNREVTGEPMFQRARLGMGYLPQEESIFRKLTVRENILAVMETQEFTDAEREVQCQQLMEKFGIDHVANNLSLTLSGGEKRRLTIARSLVSEPKLIMLDEPFSGVDPLAVEDIQKIILMLRSVGLAILITDHNVRETLSIVDRAYLIHEGKVLLHGTRESIVNDPVARERYLGENFSM